MDLYSVDYVSKKFSGYQTRVYTSEYGTIIAVPVETTRAKSIESFVKPLAAKIPRALLSNLTTSDFVSRLYAQIKQPNQNWNYAIALLCLYFSLADSVALMRFLAGLEDLDFEEGLRQAIRTFPGKILVRDIIIYPWIISTLLSFFDKNGARAVQLHQAVDQIDNTIVASLGTAIVLVRKHEVKQFQTQIRILGYDLIFPLKQAL